MPPTPGRLGGGERLRCPFLLLSVSTGGRPIFAGSAKPIRTRHYGIGGRYGEGPKGAPAATCPISARTPLSGSTAPTCNAASYLCFRPLLTAPRMHYSPPPR